MLTTVDLIRQTRKNLLSVMDSLSEVELNTVPAGFNNNIIWNAAHVVTTIQLLCYKNSGLEGYLDERFVVRYRKGSRPEADISATEIEGVKKLLLDSADRLESDYEAGLFSSYEPYATSFGVKLNTIEDALGFMVIHEGLHLGYVMALRRAVKTPERSA